MKVDWNVPTHFSTGNELMANDLRPYFDNFVEQAKCLNKPLTYKTLSIELKRDTISYLGLCTWREDGHMSIVIDETIWNYLSYPNREKVIMHELLHCTRQAKHVPMDADSGVVMGEYLAYHMQDDFMNHYDFRVKEAFGALDNTECRFTYSDLEEVETPSHIMALRGMPWAGDESSLPPVLMYGPNHAH